MKSCEDPDFLAKVSHFPFLALVKDVDGSFVQVGIVSFGASNGCEDGYPSGQVLVHKFIDWIQHVTGLVV